MRRLLLAGLALAPLLAGADEGMWTFNNFPAKTVEKAYGFKVTDAWLTTARLASVRLAQGCSASFVSPSGLVMTNHHCAHSCIEQLSTRERDFVKTGFYAKAPADEVKCPELEVNQLVSITDVTRRVTEATAGKEGAELFKAQRATLAAIEKECQTSEALRCEVVSLYRGGVYDLYAYRRYQDVRLVFAPEFAIAFFGGDPDNFTFPRFDLDLAFVRVYDGGKPAATPQHLRWSAAGARDGELTFVSGNPGRTSRALTVAQLAYQRDVALPERLISLSETRGQLTEYQHRGEEQARHSNATLFYVENSLKALTGRWQALLDEAFFASKVREEEAFKAALAKRPDLAATALPAYDAIAKATEAQKAIRQALELKELARAGDLLRIARDLVRGAAERQKPNAERLKEFSDAALPALTQELFSEAPVFPEYETFRLTHYLTKIREKFGMRDPFVRAVLGARAPAELAAELVKGTRLAAVAERRRLWEGGQAAVDAAAATDPLLALAKRMDPFGREVRTVNDETVQPVLIRNQEILARARFALEGTSRYPDATFTPRVSYGAVKGYVDNGTQVTPFTTFGGAFDYATGRDPYALPQSWLDAKGKLDLSTPFDFVTTNDIIGGNSGSPVFNRDLEVVGLIFDGNIQSLGGDYGFDASVNRAVAVHSAAIVEALSKVYGAQRVVDELKPPRVTTRK